MWNRTTSSRSGLIVFAACATLALAGCQNKAKTTASDATLTVVTVDGDAVTADDLKLEEGGLHSSDAATQAELDRAALTRIIDRKLMAKAAVAQSLDKTPEYAIESRRAVEGVQASALARKLTAAAESTAPTTAQAEAFIAAHPEAFSQRKLYFVDRILMKAQPGSLATDKDLTTLDEIQAALDSKKVGYSRNLTTVDSATASPELAARIAQFKPHVIFEVSNGEATSANVINEIRPAPITGDAAVQAAIRMLKAKAGQDAVQKELASLRASKKIVYSPGYEPAPAPAAPAKPAG